MDSNVSCTGHNDRGGQQEYPEREEITNFLGQQGTVFTGASGKQHIRKMNEEKLNVRGKDVSLYLKKSKQKYHPIKKMKEI